MSNTLTVIAKVEIKRGNVERVEKELLKLIDPTRKEEGCLRYELHQDNQNKECFIFVESWENQALLEAHMQSTHLQNFINATEGMLLELVVHQMQRVA